MPTLLSIFKTVFSHLSLPAPQTLAPSYDGRFRALFASPPKTAKYNDQLLFTQLAEWLHPTTMGDVD
jgi:hypothetical protein